ncbi:phycobiliprotein lyase [Spirulina subsalsa FACHB-351]|uniref:Chromophore lyase CpcS/CpeS n=1 Tax=Spirulina subsalsa FACHB-351 TaxID=234711 RepID=A0ABT3KZS2_9CYAN|nr:phycobiliprotein lyase [Spirulina subsalsa]MCW6034742.1 phycobiliprotein lyase [Spirulina subsalsa FACHB-351]
MDTTVFHQFFDHCVGNWQTERTYHYLTKQEVERSHTDFQIAPLSPALKLKVLTDNLYPTMPDVDPLPGFSLGFQTVSEHGDKVSQTLNLLFVPQEQRGEILTGDYLRDRAYEESRPIISQFSFNNSTRELLMTTQYTRVVSVDSITLINPTLRIRRIYNYQRPEAGQPLDTLLLVGFGVEQKEQS